MCQQSESPLSFLFFFHSLASSNIFDPLDCSCSLLIKRLLCLGSCGSELSTCISSFVETISGLASAEEVQSLCKALHTLADAEAKVAKLQQQQVSLSLSDCVCAHAYCGVVWHLEISHIDCQRYLIWWSHQSIPPCFFISGQCRILRLLWNHFWLSFADCGDSSEWACLYEYIYIYMFICAFVCYMLTICASVQIYLWTIKKEERARVCMCVCVCVCGDIYIYMWRARVWMCTRVLYVFLTGYWKLPSAILDDISYFNFFLFFLLLLSDLFLATPAGSKGCSKCRSLASEEKGCRDQSNRLIIYINPRQCRGREFILFPDCATLLWPLALRLLVHRSGYDKFACIVCSDTVVILCIC